MGIYIGDSSSKARKIKNIFIGGSNNLARKVKAVYIGDVNGVARLVWQSVKKKIISYNGVAQMSTFTDDIYHLTADTIYRVNDNHILIGMSSRDYYSETRGRSTLVNVHLDNNGNVTSGSSFVPSSEDYDMRQSVFNSIGQFNNTYGACITSVYHNGGGNSAMYLCSFNLNVSETYIERLQIEYGTSSFDYYMPIVNLNNDCILIPKYNDNGYVYASIYRVDSSGKMNGNYLGCITNYTPSYKEVTSFVPSVFALSGNRFAVVYAVKQWYSEDIAANKNVIVNIYSYSVDSSGNTTATNVSSTVLPFSPMAGNVASLDNDYFIISGTTTSIGLHIDSNNNVTVTNAVDASGYYITRIGTTDSAITQYGYIIYYDKTNNTISVTNKAEIPYILQKISYKEDSVLYASASYSYVVALHKMTFG